jgi:hypothetical protein
MDTQPFSESSNILDDPEASVVEVPINDEIISSSSSSDIIDT